MTKNYSAYRLIWQIVAVVPCGRVATYGQIARLAGLPRGARLVGRALAKLPADSTTPWHRVIDARGAIAFPPASESYRVQRQRLLAEGVPVAGRRVDLQRFGWQPTLDELLWKPPET